MSIRLDRIVTRQAREIELIEGQANAMIKLATERGGKIRKQEREIADLKAERDSETFWAQEYFENWMAESYAHDETRIKLNAALRREAVLADGLAQIGNNTRNEELALDVLTWLETAGWSLNGGKLVRK